MPSGNAARALAGSAQASELEITLYTKVGMGDGQQANNPWLQEFPDPITRTTWDNYLTMSSKDAEKYGVTNWHEATGGLNSSLVELNCKWCSCNCSCNYSTRTSSLVV